MSATAERAAIVAQVSCAALCDAMMRRHAHRAHITNLVSPAPDRRIFAQAVTMAFLPHRGDRFADDRYDFGAMLLEAVEDEPGGKVLVASCGGYPDQPIAGGKKLSRLANLGMAGVLSDARLRDFAEVVDLGIAAWVSGETVRQAGTTITPCAANVPVAVAGVTVFPGDWVVADRSGAVIIPAADLDEILAEALTIEGRDAETVARVRAQDHEWLAARPRSDR